MPSDWKRFLPFAAAVPIAAIVGTGIARGEWFWPAVALTIALLAIFARLAPNRLPAFVLGGLIAGYFLGNRGFAQLSVSGTLPLFPAELGLAIIGTWLLWECARERTLPIVKDVLNVSLIVWIVIGCLRIVGDLRIHGVDAVRDFAMIYYALFFFVAQFVASRGDTHWLRRVILTSSGALLPLFLLFEAFPDFFTYRLTIRDTPVIFFKGDLAGTFMSVGALAWLLRHEEKRQQWGSLVMGLALAATMMSTGNRASMLALAVAAVFLAAAGRTAILKKLIAAAVAGIVIIAAWTVLSGRPWSQSPLMAFYERTASIFDFRGERTYRAESVEQKGDNNQFRTVWWKVVIDETNSQAPLRGLGFGHDLATPFLRTYYPDSDDIFTARSPHNVFITIYARMGAIGLAAWLVVTIAIGIGAIRSMRHLPLSETLPACTAVALLTSATFGVVLEGPMGAVVFWIALGIAHGTRISSGVSRAPAIIETPANEPSTLKFADEK